MRHLGTYRGHIVGVPGLHRAGKWCDYEKLNMHNNRDLYSDLGYLLMSDLGYLLIEPSLV